MIYLCELKLVFNRTHLNNTQLEREVIARHDAAAALISHLAASSADDPSAVYMPSMLTGALFCGHLVTDMDSIAGCYLVFLYVCYISLMILQVLLVQPTYMEVWWWMWCMPREQ